MDTEILIAEVFKRPCIWDKRIKEYANRNIVDRAWKEISKEMSVEVKFFFILPFIIRKEQLNVIFKLKQQCYSPLFLRQSFVLWPHCLCLDLISIEIFIYRYYYLSVL